VTAADPVSGEPRWVVFPSRDTHASFATLEMCQALTSDPCLQESCGYDGPSDAGAFERLLPFVNAGEESAPRVTDLSPIGFPGEDAWLDQDFCGALGGSSCAFSVRQQLLSDPFL
jgi:hypothetical protein